MPLPISPEFLDSLDDWIKEHLGAVHHAESIRYRTSQGYWEVTVTGTLPGESLIMSDTEFRERIAAWTFKCTQAEAKIKEYLDSAQISSEEETIDRLFEERP